MLNFDFKNPDYNAVALHRIDMLTRITAKKDGVLQAKAYYRDHIDDFINDWGMTLDPRNKDIELPSLIPFVLFQRQREYVQWVIDRWRKRRDGMCEKSRDMGVSWLSAAIAGSLLVLHPEIVVGFGSRKEEYVSGSTPKSLFWKIEQFIAHLPPVFRPAKSNLKITQRPAKIENTETGSWITGEAGDNIGRGDRASIYFIDEAAFIERQESVDAALSQTANCKLYVSTIAQPGDAFHQKKLAGEIDVFEFDWRDDPRKDERWYQAQKKKFKHDPIIVAREIDRDYGESSGDNWIGHDLIRRAKATLPNSIHQDLHNQKIIIGVDSAHFGDDESVITIRAGRIVFPQATYTKKDGPFLAGEIIEYVNVSRLIIHAIVIELDGPGVSCYDCLKNHTRLGSVTYGVHTSSGGDDRSFNLRALMYRRLKEWLDSPPCSIPTDTQLEVQLGSVKYSYKVSDNKSKLLLMSKKDMKKAGIKSPDRGDSLALTFAVNEDTLSAADQYEEYEQQQAQQQYLNYQVY